MNINMMSVDEVVNLGHYLGVDFEDTYTEYKLAVMEALLCSGYGL